MAATADQPHIETHAYMPPSNADAATRHAGLGPLASALAASGFASTPARRSALQQCLASVAERWAKLVARHTGTAAVGGELEVVDLTAGRTGDAHPPQQQQQQQQQQYHASQLCLPYGSFGLMRAHASVDVDVCFLAPTGGAASSNLRTPLACANALARELTSTAGDGCVYTHVGASKRCPRLKLRVAMNGAPPVELDCVFAVVPQDTVLATKASAATPASLEGVKTLDTACAGDTVSGAALAGPRFLAVTRQRLAGLVASPVDGEAVGGDALDAALGTVFVPALECMARFLAARRFKGNHFGLPRTFHLVDLLARVVDAAAQARAADDATAGDHDASGGAVETAVDAAYRKPLRSASRRLLRASGVQWPPQPEALVAAAAVAAAKLRVDGWRTVLGDLVASQHVPHMVTHFEHLKDATRSLLSDSPTPSTPALWERLLCEVRLSRMRRVCCVLRGSV